MHLADVDLADLADLVMNTLLSHDTQHFGPPGEVLVYRLIVPMLVD